MSAELVSNRKAHFDFEILQVFEAGIALKGTEIKSLRNHGGSLQEAYAHVDKGEVWLRQMHIAPYRFGNIHNHEGTRSRKLLLNRREIEEIRSKVQLKGCTLIPMGIRLVRGLAKVRLALAVGKKKFDKRRAVREREDVRAMSRAIKTKVR